MGIRIIKQKQIIIAFIILPFLISSCSKVKPYIVNDIDVYKTCSFPEKKLDENNFKYLSYALLFFPKEEDISENYVDVSFGMSSYHGNNLNFYPSESYVLDILYNEECYELEKEKWLLQYDYLQEPILSIIGYEMPVTSFTLGNFICKIIVDGNNYPRPTNVKIICYNDEDKIIRFCAIYDDSLDVISKRKFIKALNENIPCEWE